MSGRKHHLLDDHRDIAGSRQVPASVVSAPERLRRPRRGRRLIPHTNHKQAEPTLLEKERNIPREHDREQVLVARRDESMLVFLKQANTGRDQPIHQPIPRMPEGLGIQINSNEA